jgi:hypothetical protein
LAIRFCLNQRDDYARKNRDGDKPASDGEIVNQLNKFHICVSLDFDDSREAGRRAISK